MNGDNRSINIRDIPIIKENIDILKEHDKHFWAELHEEHKHIKSVVDYSWAEEYFEKMGESIGVLSAHYIKWFVFTNNHQLENSKCRKRDFSDKSSIIELIPPELGRAALEKKTNGLEDYRLRMEIRREIEWKKDKYLTNLFFGEEGEDPSRRKKGIYENHPTIKENSFNNSMYERFSLDGIEHNPDSYNNVARLKMSALRDVMSKMFQVNLEDVISKGYRRGSAPDGPQVKKTITNKMDYGVWKGQFIMAITPPIDEEAPNKVKKPRITNTIYGNIIIPEEFIKSIPAEYTKAIELITKQLDEQSSGNIPKWWSDPSEGKLSELNEALYSSAKSIHKMDMSDWKKEDWNVLINYYNSTNIKENVKDFNHNLGITDIDYFLNILVDDNSYINRLGKSIKEELNPEVREQIINSKKNLINKAYKMDILSVLNQRISDEKQRDEEESISKILEYYKQEFIKWFPTANLESQREVLLVRKNYYGSTPTSSEQVENHPLYGVFPTDELIRIMAMNNRPGSFEEIIEQALKEIKNTKDSVIPKRINEIVGDLLGQITPKKPSENINQQKENESGQLSPAERRLGKIKDGLSYFSGASPDGLSNKQFLSLMGNPDLCSASPIEIEEVKKIMEELSIQEKPIKAGLQGKLALSKDIMAISKSIRP